MTLLADLHVTFPEFALALDLRAEPGEVIALLGPNGAGKSTALRAMAGLLPIDRGSIAIGGVTVDDPASDVFVPAEYRSVGVVFQDYLLFPHLSALARALAFRPALLLLDEPLAALDAATRGDVRRDLRQHLAGFDGATVIVTHDPVDAYALADRVIVVEAGAVVQEGALADVAAHPRSRYVAELVGINLLAGTVRGDVLTTEAGGEVVVVDTSDGDAFAAIRPQSISLHLQHPEGSQRNVWRLTVGDIDQQHDRVRVRLQGAVPLVAEITPAALTSLGFRPGDDIWAAVKATEITTYPR